MELKERLEKFDQFLTKFEKTSGATGLCEAVRSAAKVCFEGLGTIPSWADPGLIDPKYKDNVVASSRDIHRKVTHDIPLARYKARMMAKKKAQGEECATGTACADAQVEESVAN